MNINGKPCMIESAADFPIMRKGESLEKFTYKLLIASKVMLKTYTGEVRHMLGEMQCSTVCKGKQYYVPILVHDNGAKHALLFKNF